MIVKSTKLTGEITIPGSKSYTHRALLAAALASGESKILNVYESMDIITTLEMIKKIGAKVEKFESGYKIIGVGGNINVDIKEYEANESGSSLRFIIPILLTRKNNFGIIGDEKLLSRPLDTYEEIFLEQKIQMTKKYTKIKVNGNLEPGKYNISGDKSSQFLTGLLFALPLLNGDSTIQINGFIQSKDYIELTIDILKKAKIDIKKINASEYFIKGNQQYQAFDYEIEGDYSQASNYIVASVLNDKPIKLNGLNENSLQGDKFILSILNEMEIKYEFNDGLIIYPSKVKAIDIDLKDIPDLGPILTLLAIYANQNVKLYNAKRLRYKESDRIKSTVNELQKFGVNIEEGKDYIQVKKSEKLNYSGIVDTHNDHRICMMLTIMMLINDGEIKINKSSSIKKSYPTFFEDFKQLGGNIDE